MERQIGHKRCQHDCLKLCLTSNNDATTLAPMRRDTKLGYLMDKHEVMLVAPIKVPILRRFEVIAIGCGLTTLIGTFLVTSVALKGAIIGVSLVTLVAALLYFAVISLRQREQPIRVSAAGPGPVVRATAIVSMEETGIRPGGSTNTALPEFVVDKKVA